MKYLFNDKKKKEAFNANVRSRIDTIMMMCYMFDDREEEDTFIGERMFMYVLILIEDEDFFELATHCSTLTTGARIFKKLKEAGVSMEYIEKDHYDLIDFLEKISDKIYEMEKESTWNLIK